MHDEVIMRGHHALVAVAGLVVAVVAPAIVGAAGHPGVAMVHLYATGAAGPCAARPYGCTAFSPRRIVCTMLKYVRQYGN
jgi:hypothetical protein